MTPTRMRRRRVVRTAVLAAVAAAVVVILALPGTAVGLIRDAVAPPPANPTSADQIQNIDQVKTAIKGYYGDMIDPPGSTRSTARRLTRSRRPVRTPTRSAASSPAPKVPAKRPTVTTAASLLRQGDRVRHRRHDVNTYSYEIYSNYVFNGTTNGGVRQQRIGSCSRPCRTWWTSSTSPKPGLHGLLPDRPPRDSQRTGTTPTSPTRATTRPTPTSISRTTPRPWLASCRARHPAPRSSTSR